MTKTNQLRQVKTDTIYYLHNIGREGPFEVLAQLRLGHQSDH